jgi:hypothetical protein
MIAAVRRMDPVGILDVAHTHPLTINRHITTQGGTDWMEDALVFGHVAQVGWDTVERVLNALFSIGISIKDHVHGPALLSFAIIQGHSKSAMWLKSHGAPFVPCNLVNIIHAGITWPGWIENEDAHVLIQGSCQHQGAVILESLDWFHGQGKRNGMFARHGVDRWQILAGLAMIYIQNDFLAAGIDDQSLAQKTDSLATEEIEFLVECLTMEKLEALRDDLVDITRRSSAFVFLARAQQACLRKHTEQAQGRHCLSRL